MSIRPCPSPNTEHRPRPPTNRDKWCRRHLNPKHRRVLEGINTEACEGFFSWLLSFVKILRSTNPYRFPIIALYIVHLRNIQVTMRRRRTPADKGPAPGPVRPTACPFLKAVNEEVMRGEPLTVDIQKALAVLDGAEAQAKVAAYVDGGGPAASQHARNKFRLAMRELLVSTLGKGGL